MDESGMTNDVEQAMWKERRAWMVRTQLEARGIRAPRVLEAMGRVPREAFVPPDLRERAYADMPLPIGHGATLSQPYVVAHMTALADVHPGDRVLEIGTGSGYQAAILRELGAEVHSIETEPALADQARARLTALGYDGIHVRAADGYEGWPEAAPFSAIIVTAAPSEVPQALCEQLSPGGRMLIPVGPRFTQELLLITRSPHGFDRRPIEPVAFVPMRRRS